MYVHKIYDLTDDYQETIFKSNNYKLRDFIKSWLENVNPNQLEWHFKREYDTLIIRGDGIEQEFNQIFSGGDEKENYNG